ncbi:MAG TPA: hypothetical protein VN841_25100 [Bryobacteraceae bacterium]|nr:hypothetical protein [Bryobacteraceae bacterium]
MSKTIEDVQNEYARTLRPLVPPGCSPVVSLLDHAGRKKRRDAAAHNWDPLHGSVCVTFAKEDLSAPPSTKAPENLQPQAGEAAKVLSRPLSEAIRALDAAEHRVSFVALKWFRDQFLPSCGLSWAAAPYAGQEVVGDAIQRGLFLTNKVQNPKAPAFPTTAIRLNRQMLEVQKVLGTAAAATARSFRPVEIAGEPLSATIIRERR